MNSTPCQKKIFIYAINSLCKIAVMEGTVFMEVTVLLFLFWILRIKICNTTVQRKSSI